MRVDINFTTQLDFPALTVCNFNKYRESALTPSDLVNVGSRDFCLPLLLLLLVILSVFFFFPFLLLLLLVLLLLFCFSSVCLFSLTRYNVHFIPPKAKTLNSKS